MAMYEINVLGFWNRFDQARKDTIEVVCENTGLSVGTIKGLRTHKKLPNLLDTISIADYLNVTLDWLVLGKVGTEKDNEVSKVMKAYQDSDTITKILVLKVLKLD